MVGDNGFYIVRATIAKVESVVTCDQAFFSSPRLNAGREGFDILALRRIKPGDESWPILSVFGF